MGMAQGCQSCSSDWRMRAYCLSRSRHRRCRRRRLLLAGARLPRAWVRMAEPQQLLLKRQRIATSASAESAAQPQDRQQQTAAGPAPDQQQQQPAAPGSSDGGTAKPAGSGSPRRSPGAVKPQQQGQAQQGQARKPKAVVMPTPVPPPTIPADPAAWDNAVLLIDKPLGWTSFDVCGKLRHALAALLRKKKMEVKVGHAGESGHGGHLWRVGWCARDAAVASAGCRRTAALRGA